MLEARPCLTCLAAGATVVFAAANLDAVAADYPVKPVRIIVPTSPGAGLDAITRLVAQKLSERSGKTFVVDNRAGAGGAIGMELGAQAAPDGYTLVMVSLTHLAISTVSDKPAVDILKDFEPVCWVSSSPFLLNIHPSVPARNVKELLALAKAKPSAIAYGSTGAGSIQHLAVVLLSRLSGANFFHVPYKGGAQVINDLLGGQIQMSFNVYQATKAHMPSGRIRALAVTTAKRAPALPNMPAIAETLPGYEINTWYGIIAPARTATPILDWLHRELSSILQQPSIREGLTADATEVVSVSRDEFGRHLAREVTKWREIVRQAGVANR